MEYTKKYVQKLEKQLKDLREQKESVEELEQGYIIFRQDNEHDFIWHQFTAMVGSSPEDAIEKATAFGPITYGTFMAVPSIYYGKMVRKPRP